MESNYIFYFIDGNNLSINELKNRLNKMGFEKLDINNDFSYFADLYNDILNTKDYTIISKIKNLLQEDIKKPNFSELLNRKRIRNPNSEKKLSNNSNYSSSKDIYSFSNNKNE